MTQPNIYVVDDEQTAREGIALALRKTGRVSQFADAESALAALRGNPPDLVLLDIGLPGLNGIEALEQFKKHNLETPVIMITAYEDVKTVVSAMKLGAYDYVVKPVQMDGLVVSVKNALEASNLKREIRALREEVLKENLPCMIGESNALQDVMDIVAKVAKSPDTPVLIQGDTGTGKELIAEAIHNAGANFGGELVSVNCAAIPDELVESELFGYEKGAFSGAEPSGKQGLVEKASGGTLFLDEIGDLSSDAQAKILRFLEKGEFYRVGGTKTRKVATRIVSATNRDLLQMIDGGRFRRDLYYRLAVVKIEAPSLNQRPDDIPAIAEHFLSDFKGKFNKSIQGFAPEAMRALQDHVWTGNVRELKNVVERGVLLADGPMVEPSDLGLEGSKSARETPGLSDDGLMVEFSREGIDLPSVLQNVERYYYRKALEATGGSDTKSARMLGLTRDTFRYRKKGLKPEDG